jgi:hypothetical protein
MADRQVQMPFWMVVQGSRVVDLRAVVCLHLLTMLLSWISYPVSASPSQRDEYSKAISKIQNDVDEQIASVHKGNAFRGRGTRNRRLSQLPHGRLATVV